MIGRVLPRGHKVAGLLYYLYGQGRANTHTNPHVVAGFRDPAGLEPSIRPSGRRDFRRLTGLLETPVDALGDLAPDRPVWHCAIRAAPDDPVLTDAQWARIAAEVMHRTGLHRADDPCGVRWVAIRHADDHIHLVATLARQDGTRPSLHNDYYRVREACRAAERRYGLRSTAPADRTADRRATRAETEKAARRHRPEPPRSSLRRTVQQAAACAADLAGFFTRLRSAGVFAKVRYSVRDPGQITGYAVALPDDRTAAGEPVWYSGGRLAPDLTWPKLTHRWNSPQSRAKQHRRTIRGGTPPATPPRGASIPRVTGAERAAAWEHATAVARRATHTIRSDPASGADAAWAAADTLHATAALVGSPHLHKAAALYARAARPRYGRLPARTPIGDQLRATARLIAATGTGHQATATAALLVALARLLATIADLHAEQHRTAQHHATHRAIRHLDVAAGASADRDRLPPPEPSQVAGLDHPSDRAEGQVAMGWSGRPAGQAPTPQRRRQRGSTRSR